MSWSWWEPHLIRIFTSKFLGKPGSNSPALTSFSCIMRHLRIAAVNWKRSLVLHRSLLSWKNWEKKTPISAFWWRRKIKSTKSRSLLIAFWSPRFHAHRQHSARGSEIGLRNPTLTIAELWAFHHSRALTPLLTLKRIEISWSIVEYLCSLHRLKRRCSRSAKLR